MASTWASEDRGPLVLAVTATMIAVATVFVALRLVSRAGIVKRVTPDDYIIVLAWFIAFGLSFAICLSVHFGLGRHEATLTTESQEALVKLEYAFSVLYNPALMATKTSILLFYLTLGRGDKILTWSTIGTLVVVNVAGFALAMLNIFQCRPMSALFQLPRPESAKCTDVITLYLSSAPVNIITDLCILLLPMPVLKALRLPRKQKLILYVTFGFGIFVTAVDVVRIAYLQQATLTRLQDVQENKNTPEMETTDFSWYASLSFMWSAIEVNVGIMCACVPALKPLVSRFLPRMLRDAGEITPPQRGSIVTMDSAEMAEAHRVPSVPQLQRVPTLQTHGHAEDEGNEMSFTDFLSGPDMTGLAPIQRTQTAMTDLSGQSPMSARGNNFFDFVNMAEQKPLVYMTSREAIRPIAEVTLLFFLWGFAYGLLNTLNAQFQITAKMSSGQTTAIHAAYFIGYLIGPPTLGRLVLKKWGFKACFIVGLIIYGTGTLVFWPSAVLQSFAAFFISNLIVGLGLSILEIAANPFIILCGPAEYAEVRLNLSQGIQACGGVVSPVLAKKALFQNVLDAPSLIDVQWTYLAITLFTFFLAFIYYLLKVPEATDDELEEAAALTYDPPVLNNLRQTKTIWITLALATTAQFIYVGAQEAVSTSLGDYLTVVQPGADSVNVSAIGHSLFAASRFFAAFLGYFLHIKPRYLLFFFFGGSMVFSILCMQNSITGFSGTVMVMCLYFFEGPIFSLIFAQGLRGLGRYSKDGSAALTTAIGGGAILPRIMSAVAQSNGIRYAFCVPVALYVLGLVLPIYLQAVPTARTQVTTRIGQKRQTLHLGWSGRRGGLGSLGGVRKRKNTATDSGSTVAPSIAPAGAACTTEYIDDDNGWGVITRDFHPVASPRLALPTQAAQPKRASETLISPTDLTHVPWGLNVGGGDGVLGTGIDGVAAHGNGSGNGSGGSPGSGAGATGDYDSEVLDEEVQAAAGGDLHAGRDRRVQSWASSTTPLWRGVRKLSAAFSGRGNSREGVVEEEKMNEKDVGHGEKNGL